MMNFKKRSSGQFLACTVVETNWSDEVLQYSLALLEKIGYYGYTGTQFKLDPRDGHFKLMEINGRITMSNSLALKCGINLPHLMYKEAIKGPLQPIEKIERENYPDKIIWWYLVHDIVSFYKYNRKFTKISEYLKSLKGKGYMIEPMNWRDPLPGLITLMLPVRILLNRIFKKNKK